MTSKYQVGNQTLALGDTVASARTGKTLGKVVHLYRDGVQMAFVKEAPHARAYRYQAIDLVRIAN